jgi:hypothetical protein
MSVSSDFKDLLRLFNENQVEYLVVGGYAVIKYTEPRFTKDLDLWIRASRANAVAVFRALREFGAPLAKMTADDFAQEGYFYQMGLPPLRIDILMSITGLTFEEAWNRRVEGDFDGVLAWFISRDDLIRSKTAAGRPQDLIDADSIAQAQQQLTKRTPRHSPKKRKRRT